MKPSKELYQRTFSRLKPSPKFGKELLTMTENVKRPKKFVMRRLIAIAAVLALVFALAMGANAATGGELYEATIGRLVYTFKTDNGVARIYQGESDDGGKVSFIIEEDRVEGGYKLKAKPDPSAEYEKSVEVETDENGNIVSVQEGEGSRQVELMEQLGQPIGVRDSKNGITISADSLLSDGENALVLYTVSRDDGKPLVSPEESRGDHLNFRLRGEGKGSIEHPVGLGMQGNKFLDEERGQNAVHYLGCYTAPNGFPKKMTIQFGSLGLWDTDTAKWFPIYSDSAEETASPFWELEIPFDSGESAVKTVSPEKASFSANGESFAITDIKISPISLSVEYEVTSATPSNHAASVSEKTSEDGTAKVGEYHDDTSAFTADMTLILRKKSGEEIHLDTVVDEMGFETSSGNTFTLWDQDKYICRFGDILPEIVPLDEMDCIIFNDLEIPVN